MSLALEISDIVPGQSASQVGIKLTVGRYFDGFKAAVAGDKLFDNSVDIDVEWSCSPTGSGSDKLSIAAGEASVEKTYSNFPKKLSDDEVNCRINATLVDIKNGDYPVDAAGSFFIDEFELTVIITESSKGKPLGYTISEGATTLQAKVEARLSCSADYHGLLSLQQDRRQILYARKISALPSTGDGRLFAWSDANTRCTLGASSGSGSNRKRGRSERFSVNKHEKLFGLNTQGQLVTADGSKMMHMGKFYVYPSAKPQDKERELVGFINVPAEGVASGTNLQVSASDSTGLKSLAARDYFIFYEKSSSEVIVFYDKISN